MGAAKKLVDKEVLKSLVPLNALSDTHFNELIKKAKIEEMGSGHYLFKKGDRDNQAIYVLSGEVILLQGRKEQSVVVAATTEALHPIAPQQPRQFTARTKGRTTIMSIDAGLLDVMLTWDQSSGSGYEVSDIHSEEDEDWMTRMLQSELLVKLPALNIQQLIMRMEEVEAKSGETIVQQDEEGDYYYIIKEGTCVVARKLSERGKPIKLAELIEGASFGEEALLSGGKRNASIIMKTDGLLMRLSKQDFDELLKDPLIKQVDYKQGKKIADKEGAWIDVRLPGEYRNGHIPGSINIPLAAIRDETGQLDSGKKYVVYCDTGRRSASAIFLLGQRGFDGCILTDGLASVPHKDLKIIKDTSITSADVIPFNQLESEHDNENENENDKKVHAINVHDLEKRGQTNKVRQERMDALEHDLNLKEDEINKLRLEIDKNTQLQEEARRFQSEMETAISRSSELEEQLRESTSSKSTFEEELATLTSRLNKETQEHQITREKLANLDKQTREYRQVESDLQQEIRNIQDEKAGLQARLQEEDSIRKELEQRLATEQQSRNKLEQDKQYKETGLDNELAELKSSLAAQEEARQQVEQQLVDLEEQFKRKSGELEEVEAEFATLKSQMEDVSEIQRNLDIEIDARNEAEQKAENLNNELSELQGRLKEHEVSRQQAEQQLEAIEQEYSEARELLENSQSEIEKLKSDQNELGTVQEDIDAERNKRIELEEQLASLEKEFIQKSEELKLTEAEFASLQSQLEKAVEAQGALEIEIDARKNAEQQVLVLEQESLEVKKALDDSKEEISAFESRLDALSDVQENLVAEREERESLQQQLETISQDIVKAQKDLELANSEIEHLQSLQNEMLDTQKKLDAETEIRKQAEHHLDSLREEHEKSENALAIATEELDTIRMELDTSIEELLKNIDELTKENKALQDQAEEISNKADEDKQRYQDERDSWQSLQQEFESLKNDEGVLTQQLEEVILHRDNLQQELSDLEADLQQSTESEKEARKGLEDEIQYLRQELDNMKNKEEEHKSKENDLEEELAKLSADLEQANTYASELDKENNNDLDSSLRDENEILRRELENIYREQEVAIETGRAPKKPKPLDIPNLFQGDDEDDLSESVPMPAGTPVKEENTHKDPFAIADLDKKAFQPTKEGVRGGKRWRTFMVFAVALVLVLGGAFYFLSKPEERDEMTNRKNRIDDVGELSNARNQAVEQQVVEQVKTKIIQPKKTVSDNRSTSTPKTSTSTKRSIAEVPEHRKVPRKIVPRIIEQKVVVPGNTGDAVSKSTEKAEPVSGAEPVVSLMSAGRTYSDALKAGGRGPVMVKVPSGQYEMGSASSSTYFDERPKHTVNLKAFSISKYEVTFNEYDRYAEAEGLPKPDDNGWGRSRRPVINISWEEANAYARWLSEQTGHKYRLPSEAEWEYVARAGSKTLYWWGSLFSGDKANCFNCDGQWAGEGTAPVGSFKANPLGLHDISGNVMEWTQDCFHKTYAGAPVDGSAWQSPGCVSRMLRGGSYRTTAVSLRTSKREHLPSEVSADNVGFRLVRIHNP